SVSVFRRIVEIRLKTVEIQEQTGGRKIGDFFHGREFTTGSIHKLCGSKYPRFVPKLRRNPFRCYHFGLVVKLGRVIAEERERMNPRSTAVHIIGATVCL